MGGKQDIQKITQILSMHLYELLYLYLSMHLLPGGCHCNPFQYSYLENPNGQSNLEGYSPCGRKESDMTERLSTCTFLEITHKTFEKLTLS